MKKSIVISRDPSDRSNYHVIEWPIGYDGTEDVNGYYIEHEKGCHHTYKEACVLAQKRKRQLRRKGICATVDSQLALEAIRDRFERQRVEEESCRMTHHVFSVAGRRVFLNGVGTMDERILDCTEDSEISL